MKRTGGVKHFLILKTEEGLQLKGSSEPTFSKWGIGQQMEEFGC